MFKKSIKCISLLFIGCGISYYLLDYNNHIIDEYNNKLLIGDYMKYKTEVNAILEIPSIDFKRVLYKIDNPKNNINKNIVFLDYSDMPSESNSRVVIAGHSGSTYNSYFKKLNKIKYNDEIIMYYEKCRYIYVVKDIYEIEKTGNMAIESSKTISSIVLITCLDNNKQLIVIGKLKEKRC